MQPDEGVILMCEDLRRGSALQDWIHWSTDWKIVVTHMRTDDLRITAFTSIIPAEQCSRKL